jgi:hypothetical protein
LCELFWARLRYAKDRLRSSLRRCCKRAHFLTRRRPHLQHFPSPNSHHVRTPSTATLHGHRSRSKEKKSKLRGTFAFGFLRRQRGGKGKRVGLKQHGRVSEPADNGQGEQRRRGCDVQVRHHRHAGLAHKHGGALTEGNTRAPPPIFCFLLSSLLRFASQRVLLPKTTPSTNAVAVVDIVPLHPSLQPSPPPPPS